MLHPFDTHFWLAKLTDGQWISAEDYSSADPIFARAVKVRIEPLSMASIQAILEAEIPPGYTTFLRTDIHRDLADLENIAKLGYIMALERGLFPDRGTLNLSELPLEDGFRAELCCWNGDVAFDSSSNFRYEINNVAGIDIYKFIMK